MKVLVTFGSKRGGTAELAARVAQTLREQGFAVDCVRASAARELANYDAFVIGGALYARRWFREAKRFVVRNAAVLRQHPVWMFSSGPLDDSAVHHELPPVPAVARLMARVGARGHATFGGRLAANANGFVAAAMAKKSAGDWRSWEQVRSWASTVARNLKVDPGPVAVAPKPSTSPLAAVCLATGITAIGGGIALIAGPDGRYIHMPTATLAHSPFSTFLVPGLLLLFVVGMGNLVAGLLVRRRHARANNVAFVSGGALWCWMVAEMTMLRTANAFQIIYLVASIAIIGLALRKQRRAPEFRPPRPARSAG